MTLGRFLCRIGLHRAREGTCVSGVLDCYIGGSPQAVFIERGLPVPIGRRWAGDVPWYEYTCARCERRVRDENWGER